jgi:phosphomannomutase
MPFNELRQVKSYQFSPTILRAYDIRGTTGKNLHEVDAYFLGRSFASYMQQHGYKGKICIGYDGRLSSPGLNKHLAQGLLDSGIDIMHIGLVPTPALYFATYELGCDAGIEITGSHNPPADNGFKMMLGGASFFAEKIQTLGEIAAQGKFIEGQGKITEIDIKPKYLARLLQSGLGKTGRELRVAWDPGNGATGEMVKLLADKIPGKHFLINEKIDGHFPAHHPDPTLPENLEQLIALVKRERCDLGIAFDGDGDRLGAVDQNGRIIYGDQILLLYARELAKKHPGAKVIADVKTSNAVFKKIEEFGGQALMWKTGHSHIKTKMKEEKALLAGEMSGHLFFAEDYYGFDDALFGACKLINILSHDPQSFAQIIDTFPHPLTTPELRIDVDESEKFALVEKVKKLLVQQNKKFNDLDGVRVMEQDGWWLLRASNTQNALIMRIEGDDTKALMRISDEVIGYFQTVDLNIQPIVAARKQVLS